MPTWSITSDMGFVLALEDHEDFMWMANNEKGSLKDIEWTKNGSTETCLHSAKEVAPVSTQFKQGHRCFLVLT